MSCVCEICGCEVDGLYGYATCDDCHDASNEETMSTRTLKELRELYRSQLVETRGDPLLGKDA